MIMQGKRKPRPWQREHQEVQQEEEEQMLWWRGGEGAIAKTVVR